MKLLFSLTLKSLLIATFVHCAAVHAQQPFPSRSITLVVPFAPGGATDIVARLLAARLQADLGQTVIVDNRAGGAGNIGTMAVARATPDGYTLVLATTTQLINQFISKDLRYSLFTDLIPVALIADAPEVLAVTSKLGVSTTAEFVAAARARPQGVNFGSAGVGSVPHLGGEMLGRSIKAPMVHVPFRGTADAMRELAAGNIEFSFTTQASVAPFVASGLVKIVGLAAPSRVDTLAGIPTLAEGGVKDVELSNWFGIMAPKGTDSVVVDRLNKALNAALTDPDTVAKISMQGIVPVRQSPEYFGTRLKEDGVIYKRIIDEIHLAP